MKPLFITIASCAALALASCSGNEKGNGSGTGEPAPGETKSAYIKINTKAKSRSDEATASGTTATLYSALIYFIDGSSDPVVYEIMSAAPTGADLTLAELEAGVLVEDIPSSVTQVYVVGNYDVTDANGQGADFPTDAGDPGVNSLRLSDVQDVVLDIQQVSYGRLADGTVVGNLITVMDGQSTLYVYETGDNEWNGDNALTDGDYYANVTISPVVARIEIEEISYTGTLEQFTLEGIYINNYYQQMPVGLTRLAPTNNGSNPDHYDVGDSDFAYRAYSVMYDLIGDNATGPATFTPDNGVWAYQVFGNSNPVPHIILKLTDVVAAGGASLGDRYVTVSGFADGDGDDIMSFVRNTVYKITDLAFTDADIDPLPEPTDVNVWVHVEVEPWATVIVSPII
ncbi:MAG: hypothetical protein LIO85_09210 [Rikenellaceae bacterium]|nr:hypothetical protein [Rikenellaceae bacterium]